MRHYTPESSRPPTSWMGYKDQGKNHFERQEYAQALASYRAALSPEFTTSPPRDEKQIILSNIVACRLKIGGAAMASAAIEEAKQCVALNDRWAKGHVRLASAYIALGGHSNDACVALQRALSIDSGNRTAREMLVRELRRDHPRPAPSAPPSYMDTDDAGQSTTTPLPQQQERQQRYNNAFAGATPPPPPFRGPENEDLDDSLTWIDKIKFQWMQMVGWYHNQSEDVRNLLKVILGILVLYVLFGGRFGLFGGPPRRRGNYGNGNAYERFHNNDHNHYHSRGYDSHHHHHHHQRRQRSYEQQYNYDDDHYGSNSRSYSSSSSYGGGNFQFPNLLDGTWMSMLCLGAFGYFCHRNGFNPFHAIWLLNMVTGRRGGRHVNRMGMYGMGYGMMRNAGMFGARRRHGRRGWY